MSQETVEKKGWFSRLKEGLKKSSHKLTEGITTIALKRKLTAEVLDELEDLLLSTDMGVATAQSLRDTLEEKRFNQEITLEELKQFLASEIAQRLNPIAQELNVASSRKPFVLLIVGVNGSGKTTTIGKIAHYWRQQGLKVRIAAGDTFRAAAVEQLKTWSDRAGVPLVIGKEGGDAASVAFEALQMAQQEEDDVLIIDTAGRLQNKENLMAELSKIERVLKKLDAYAPHACVLVLDATTGQNAHSQVTLFKQTVGLTGLILTKLDGTAKGGVLLALAHQHGLPVYALGVGEGINDLRPFNAQEFASSLVDL